MQGVAPRALEFAILTAARSGEVLGARWEEIDFQDKVWTVRREGGQATAAEIAAHALAGWCAQREERSLALAGAIEE